MQVYGRIRQEDNALNWSDAVRALLERLFLSSLLHCPPVARLQTLTSNAPVKWRIRARRIPSRGDIPHPAVIQSNRLSIVFQDHCRARRFHTRTGVSANELTEIDPTLGYISFAPLSYSGLSPRPETLSDALTRPRRTL